MNAADLARLLNIPELPSCLNQVDKYLIESVGKANPHIKDPAVRLIKSGGKRLRPFLVIAAAKSQGGKIDDAVIRTCAAIELVHIGTIIHDDIIDKSDMRWGVPSINSHEGASHALVIGDYFLSLSAHVANSVSREVADVIAVAAMEICDGQSLETAEEYNLKRSIDSYMSAINKKTASLTSAACKVGGICAELNSSQIGALAKYGEFFGVSFQLIDDLLDFISTSEILGKPVGNDVKEGVYTLPLLLAFQKSAGKDLRKQLENGEIDHKSVVQTLSSLDVFEETIQEIVRNGAVASRTIKELGSNEVIEGLAKLPSAYLDWALQKTNYRSNVATS